MNKLSKEEARRIFKKIRSEIVCKEKKDSIIFEAFVNFEFVYKCKKVAIYSSFGSEVDTENIIIYLKARKCEIYLPRVIDNENIEFFKVDENTTYKKNKFGILEPIDSFEIINPEEIELIVVPGLAFNEAKERLGYGGGYYDRYLSKCTKAIKVGLFYREQYDYQNLIEFNSNDVCLDLIITD